MNILHAFITDVKSFPKKVFRLCPFDKLLPLTPLRVVEVGVFGYGSVPEGANRNVNFSGSSDNLPTSLGTYSQARTEHQQNPRKTADTKCALTCEKSLRTAHKAPKETELSPPKGRP